VAACRERGLRIVLDGVFNHVGRRHPWFVEAIAGGPDGPAPGDFRIDWTAADGPRAENFEGHDSLVAFDHSSDRVVDEVASVMNYWLDRGIDGWRLDAAYAVDPRFWARVLPRVRERHPEAWILGEVIHGDYAGIVEESGMDSVTQYELWKATWSSLVDRNFFELDWNLTRHNELLARFTPNTFIGNHDVTRIATRVGPQAAVLALVVLMTTGGIPSIYYGDERAATGLKEDRFGGDDAVRPAFPDSPAALSGDGAWMLRTHQQLIGLRRRNPWLVSARTETVTLTNTRYDYVTRSADGEHSLTVGLDVSGTTPRATIRDENGTVLFPDGHDHGEA
jgi:glycosidase